MPKKREVPRGWAPPNRAEHIGFLLKSLQHSLRQSMDEALRKHGLELSFAHLAALFGLYFEPGSTGAQLARRAFVSAQTMNAVLRRLEIEGRIERRPHPDSRRADSWTLTDNGVATLEQARRVGAQIFEQMLAPLGEDEVAALEKNLASCIHALDPSSRAALAPAPPNGRAHAPAAADVALGDTH